ncbi:MAG: hypothetical protein ACJAY9_000782 [Flavobacteriales bacterium]|jgi:hypothetical protein
MAGTNPITEFNLLSSLQKIGASDRIPLILAQGTSAGSFTSGALVSSISNELGTGEALCGSGSIGHLMIDTFKSLNPSSRLDAIIVSDNGTGVPAVGTVTFVASTPKSGTIYVSVGSYTKNRYAIAVSATSTATTIAVDLVAFINADTSSPVTAVNAAGLVTFTAKSKGTEGNRILIQVESLPSGVTQTTAVFASGATDPVLTGILNKIDTSRYDIIAPTAFLSSIKTHLEAKFNTRNQILDGVGIFTKTDTYANHQTALAPATLASKVIVYVCNKLVADADFKGGAMRELDYTISAYIAALRTLRLKDNASISSFMMSENNRGGFFTAGLPYANMKLNNFAIIPAGKGFDLDEIEGLGDLGGSTLSMDDSGIFAVTNKLWMTAFKKASPTADGFTYQSLNKSDCATISREYIFRNMKNYYAQAGLTAGDLPNNPLARYASEKSIRAYIVSLFLNLTDFPYNVLQISDALLAEFKENLVVVVNTSTGGVSGSMKFNLMGQLDSFTFDLTPQL